MRPAARPQAPGSVDSAQVAPMSPSPTARSDFGRRAARSKPRRVRNDGGCIRRHSQKATQEPAAKAKRMLPRRLNGRNDEGRAGTGRRLSRDLRRQNERAVEYLKKDRDPLLAFYDFPAEHWKPGNRRADRTFSLALGWARLMPRFGIGLSKLCMSLDQNLGTTARSAFN